MLSLHHIHYKHPDKSILFDDLDVAFDVRVRCALIGDNGTGKSTLLRILAGELSATRGTVRASSAPYLVPQHFGQYDGGSVAEALRVREKREALRRILAGEADTGLLELLDDDWLLEERCREALMQWGIGTVDLDAPLATLSGGEKTRVFLAGLDIHQPAIVLMDEPGNHLDTGGRAMLRAWIERFTGTLLLVTHDRGLLDIVDRVYELHERGMTAYGGSFDFYCEQKALHENALRQALRAREYALKREQRGMRETLENKSKQDARGKARKLRSGIPRIAMKKLKDTAEASTRRMKEALSDRVETLREEVARTREQLPAAGAMKLDFASSDLHRGKILVDAVDVNYRIEGRPLWAHPVSLQLRSGQRLRIGGANGSGKTTLIRLLLGELAASEGVLHRAPLRSVYIDQDYSLIRAGRTVFEQARSFNHSQLPEHEVRIILNRFLFDVSRVDKDCATLSGGERMRLLLCCMMIAAKAPDVFVLDEPTNNLDMRNADILLDAIRDYEGTMVLVSHDEHFVRALGVEEELILERYYTTARGTRGDA